MPCDMSARELSILHGQTLRIRKLSLQPFCCMQTCPHRLACTIGEPSLEEPNGESALQQECGVILFGDVRWAQIRMHGAGRPGWGPQAVEIHKVGAALARAQKVEKERHHSYHCSLQAEGVPLQGNATNTESTVHTIQEQLKIWESRSHATQ